MQKTEIGEKRIIKDALRHLGTEASSLGMICPPGKVKSVPQVYEIFTKIYPQERRDTWRTHDYREKSP